MSFDSSHHHKERVGDYLLRDTLGVGSFGHVVLGMHHVTSARAAIKVLAKDADNEAAIKRVSSEISTMEKTGRGCPFVVQLHEVLIGRNHIYLVMEYADRGELFKVMFKPAADADSDVGSPLRESRARTYFQQLVLGVHWCHEKGVAHRDLKPQNLLLDLNGVLKIADFGFAATLSHDPGLRKSYRSMRKTLCGSPLYMAPELLSLREGCSYNSLATDVWGCGAVLYAMLFGTPPFPASSFAELVQLTSKPRVNLKVPDRMRRELSTLLRSMLRLDPKQRFTLPHVARSAWFQTDLATTLSHTPNFKSPFEQRDRRGGGGSHPAYVPTQDHASGGSAHAPGEGVAPSQTARSATMTGERPRRRLSLRNRHGTLAKVGPATHEAAALQHARTNAPSTAPSDPALESRRSSVQIISEDLREAAGGLANRLRRMVRISRSQAGV